jgi:hypothetical protein
MAATKVIGWGKCKAKHTPAGQNATATEHSDIVEGSTALSVEEGTEQEALIEGGEAEARKKQPDKYVLDYERRIGSASEVTPGFTEDAGTIEIEPEQTGAVGVTLTGVSLYISLSFDSTDGLKAHYQYKTKGATDANGALTDIELEAKA